MQARIDWDQKSTNATDTIGGERRRDKRYELQLDTRWKLIRRRKVVETGRGVTVDLSSGGILIEVDRPLPVGMNLELSITWPVMLHNVAPLQLVVIGRIVRTHGSRVALRTTQHEFRTVGIPADHRETLPLSAASPLAFFSGAARFQSLGKSQ